ncbi:MAG: carboxymuconolactone decarboxylase family protein [Methanomassiliicoccales archaeon]|nr:MAG: carboxymuconolactone decarboxylase family protein [Methanomassiliicoccales archaeon]
MGEERDGEKAKEVEERLRRIEEAYGIVPFISRMISEEEDLFIGHSDFSRSLMLEPRHLDLKTLELAAIAAGSALGAEYCLDIHLRQASKHGASDGEIFEAIMAGSYMAMANGQARALRRFKDFRDSKK